MANANDTQTYGNDTATSSPTNTGLTQPRSGLVRFELIDKDGKTICNAYEPAYLIAEAKRRWPGEEQDEDRTGKGWTIQPVGADIVWQRSPLGPVKV